MKTLLAPFLAAAMLGSAAAAQEVRLPAGDYGETVLSIRESLGDAAQYVANRQNVFEPISELREDDALRVMARAVGRLDLLIDENGEAFTSTCTATIIEGGAAILTNYHCIPGFSGELTAASILLDYYSADSPVTRLRVDLAPREADPDLDYAIVPLLDAAPGDLAPIRFSPQPVRQQERLLLVHHPAGQPKMMTQFRCAAARSIGEDTGLRHSCDTQPGSSGAPIFNLAREVVGLHHSGGLNPNDPGSFNGGTMVRDIVSLAALADGDTVPAETPATAPASPPSGTAGAAIDPATATATDPAIDPATDPASADDTPGAALGNETTPASDAGALNELIQSEIGGD